MITLNIRPICCGAIAVPSHMPIAEKVVAPSTVMRRTSRSEEHTSELQSHLNLVCRLLLEKKKILMHMQPYYNHHKCLQASYYYCVRDPELQFITDVTRCLTYNTTEHYLLSQHVCTRTNER